MLFTCGHKWSGSGWPLLNHTLCTVRVSFACYCRGPFNYQLCNKHVRSAIARHSYLLLAGRLAGWLVAVDDVAQQCPRRHPFIRCWLASWDMLYIGL